MSGIKTEHINSTQHQQQKHSQKQQLEFSVSRTLLTAAYESATFLITRYPYLCAVLLMVTTAEQSKSKKSTKLSALDKNIIYGHLCIYFTTATIMAFDMFGLKRLFAIVTFLHLIIVSYMEYALTYGENITYRLLTRNIACSGCYLMVAGGIAKNKGTGDRNKILVSFGRQIIGVYAVLSSVLVWNSEEEFRAFSHHFPLKYGHICTSIIIFINTALGLFLYGGIKAVKTSKLYAILLLCITVFVDADFAYWEKTTDLKIWGTATIATRHIPILAALILVRKDYS